MTVAEDPGDRWMREEEPERWRLRSERHEFVPMTMSDAEIEAGHVCAGGCYCDRCWQPKSDRIHPRARRQR